MKHTLELQENLDVKQAEIVDIKVENGEGKAVETNIGAIYNVKAVIIATGTYLKGKISEKTKAVKRFLWRLNHKTKR